MNHIAPKSQPPRNEKGTDIRTGCITGTQVTRGTTVEAVGAGGAACWMIALRSYAQARKPIILVDAVTVCVFLERGPVMLRVCCLHVLHMHVRSAGRGGGRGGEETAKERKIASFIAAEAQSP